MNNDLVKGELSAEQQNAVMGLIGQIQNLLPFFNRFKRRRAPGLAQAGRQEPGVCGPRFGLGRAKSWYLAAQFRFGRNQRDVTLVRQLEPLVLALGQLQGWLEDTFLAAGSDAYSQTLLVYQAAKLAGKNGALEQHLDGLSRRFARKSTSATAAANTPSAH
jgi:hypothetical protein